MLSAASLGSLRSSADETGEIEFFDEITGDNRPASKALSLTVEKPRDLRLARRASLLCTSQKQPGLIGTVTKLHSSVMGPLEFSPVVPRL